MEWSNFGINSYISYGGVSDNVFKSDYTYFIGKSGYDGIWIVYGYYTISIINQFFEIKKCSKTYELPKTNAHSIEEAKKYAEKHFNESTNSFFKDMRNKHSSEPEQQKSFADPIQEYFATVYNLIYDKYQKVFEKIDLDYQEIKNRRNIFNSLLTDNKKNQFENLHSADTSASNKKKSICDLCVEYIKRELEKR